MLPNIQYTCIVALLLHSRNICSVLTNHINNSSMKIRHESMSESYFMFTTLRDAVTTNTDDQIRLFPENVVVLFELKIAQLQSPANLLPVTYHYWLTSRPKRGSYYR